MDSKFEPKSVYSTPKIYYKLFVNLSFMKYYPHVCGPKYLNGNNIHVFSKSEA